MAQFCNCNHTCAIAMHVYPKGSSEGNTSHSDSVRGLPSPPNTVASSAWERKNFTHPQMSKLHVLHCNWHDDSNHST
eukprot:3151316-Amphidinium_carterae.1